MSSCPARPPDELRFVTASIWPGHVGGRTRLPVGRARTIARSVSHRAAARTPGPSASTKDNRGRCSEEFQELGGRFGDGRRVSAAAEQVREGSSARRRGQCRFIAVVPSGQAGAIESAENRGVVPFERAVEADVSRHRIGNGWINDRTAESGLRDRHPTKTGCRAADNQSALIAMEMSGSTRPASRSEHLISHALDALSTPPKMHGLQVGVASYVISILQKENTVRIASLFDATRFWDAIAADPFSRAEWLEAVRMAPAMKQGLYTVLSSRDVLPEVEQLLTDDPRLTRCFQ
jgi:hypothetical protein